jgi:hypothetical protein
MNALAGTSQEKHFRTTPSCFPLKETPFLLRITNSSIKSSKKSPTELGFAIPKYRATMRGRKSLKLINIGQN